MILVTLLSLLGVAVANSIGNWNDVKQNWQEHRCNPMYIPVAGFIHPEVLGC
jgi:hypothetical protein